MVEYIIIVVLIAIGLIGIVSLISKAIARKGAGIASALDEDAGSAAQSAAEAINEDSVRNFSSDGKFNP